MASPYFSIVTDVGTQEMLKATNEERKVNITEFAVGDGNGAYYKPTHDMTALKREMWRGAVNSCKISAENENVLVVDTVIPSNIGGFTIREMALFDDTGKMIGIGNTPDTQKVKVSDGVVHELALSMEILLSNTDSVQLIVDPNIVTATKKDIELLRQDVTENINNVNATLQEEVQESLKITAEVQNDIDGVKNNMLRMGSVVSALTDADVMDADNVAIETFKTADDVIIISGIFDRKNNRLYA